MTPTHANKKGTRYRYYVSQKLTTNTRGEVPRARRVPARDLERVVVDRLKRFLASEPEVHAALESGVLDVDDFRRYVLAAKAMVRDWDKLKRAEQRAQLNCLVHRVDLEPQGLKLSIFPSRLLKLLAGRKPLPATTASTRMDIDESDRETLLTLMIRVRLKRVGMETRLLIGGLDPHARTRPDRSLYRLLAKAQQYRALLMENPGKSMSHLAAEAGVSASHFTRVLRLSFLAPDIVHAMLRDRHPLELNAERLSKRMDLPYAWDAQRIHLGID
jgi:hypothetical protein